MLELAVLAVFQAKCVACHGPDVKKPKGGFGYVLDLKRLAADKDRLEALRILVAAGNMPPRPAPPLSAAQKESVAAWIKAGAPVASKNVEEPPTQEPDQPPEPVAGVTPIPGFWERTLDWLGKFHLLVLHFPIALVVVAALLEIAELIRPAPGILTFSGFCVFAAAVFAVPTVVLGWLHALGGTGAGQPGTLLLHRWVGTAAGVLLVLAACSGERDVRLGRRRPLTRLAIFAAALTTGVAAHFGGTLVHGVGFLDW